MNAYQNASVPSQIQSEKKNKKKTLFGLAYIQFIGVHTRFSDLYRIGKEGKKMEYLIFDSFNDFTFPG